MASRRTRSRDDHSPGPRKAGGPERGPGPPRPWAELRRVFERHGSYAESTKILVGELAAFLRRTRLDGARRPNRDSDLAVLDVLTTVRWALDAKSPALRRLQQLANKILKANAPNAITWNRADYRTPSDLGRGLKAELERYCHDVNTGMAHDVESLADRIAPWLVSANKRVRLLDAPTVDRVRSALIAAPALRELDTRQKPDRLAALILRVVDVPAKVAWNAVNAAEGMKETRRKRKAGEAKG